MRRCRGGLAHFLLVVSIVGAILGMEIDVISGPVAPDALSVLLCELETPKPARMPAGRCSRPDTWILLPSPGASATSGPIHADEFGETSSQVFDAVWPSPLSVSPNRQCDSSRGRGVRHANVSELYPSPSSPRPRPFSLTPPSAKLSLQLCRLLI